MIKSISGWNFNDEPNCTIWRPFMGIEKTAYGTNEPLIAFLATLKPDDKHVYILENIMGAGEVWGCNSNKDYFSTEQLLKSYKTFETHGKGYRHHLNKDPNKATGDIPLAMWNPSAMRVELVKKLPIERNEDILSRMERGDRIAVSMGCKIDYDVCSWCGNKAKVKSDYCEHIRHQRGQWRNGIVCCMININPIFFDSSYVNVPADKSAYVLAKVAEDGATEREEEFPASIILGEQLYGEEKEASISVKTSTSKKVADIDKDIPSNIPDGAHVATLPELFSKFRRYAMPNMRSSEPVISPSVIDSLAGRIGDSAASLAGHGVVLKPEEFQRLLLVSSGRKDLADRFHREGKLFDTVSPKQDYSFDMGKYDHGMASELTPAIIAKSYLRKALLHRLYGDQAVPGLSARQEGMVSPSTEHKDVEMGDNDKEVMSVIGGSFQDYTRKARLLAMEIASGVKRLFPEVSRVEIKLASLHPLTYTDSRFVKHASPLGITGVALGGDIYQLAKESMESIASPVDYESSIKLAYEMAINGAVDQYGPFLMDLAILAGSLK